MGLDTEPRHAIVPLGTVDASGPDERPVFVANDACRILAVNLVDTAAKTGHADNYGKYELINKGAAGAGTGVVASRYSDTPTTDNIAAYVAWPLTVSGTASLLNLDAGNVLQFKASEEGSAASGDLTDALLVIEYTVGEGYE